MTLGTGARVAARSPVRALTWVQARGDDSMDVSSNSSCRHRHYRSGNKK